MMDRDPEEQPDSSLGSIRSIANLQEDSFRYLHAVLESVQKDIQKAGNLRGWRMLKVQELLHLYSK
jgi:hypothetical protein